MTPPPTDAAKADRTTDRTVKTADALRKDSVIRSTPAPSDTAKTDTANKTIRDYTADRSRQDLTKNTVGTQNTTGRADRSGIATPTVKTDRDAATRVDKNTPVKINDAVSTPGKAVRENRGTAPDRTIASGHTPVARPIQVNENPAGHSGGNGGNEGQININGDNNNVYVNGGDRNGYDHSGHGHDPHYYHGYYPTPYHCGHHNSLIISFGWNVDWYYHGGAYYLDSPWYSCGQIVSVPWHGYWGLTYYYPYYHRNFVFVSLGGYWPHYGYRRYYWYGCHPYRWYDYDVVYDTVPVGNTYYTTNNYYTTDSSSSSDNYTSSYFDDFSDVRQKLQQQQQQQKADQIQDKPNDESAADRNFSDAVSAFGRGDYANAALKFRVAMVLEPKDVILPFAYAQALFAKGDYAAAAGTLRSVLISISQPVQTGAQKDEGQETVYYPRGLYKKEEVLMQQIELLAAKAAANPNDTDLQLLLGYQLLGSGQADKSLTPLGDAAKDPSNSEAVRILLNLRDKVLEDQKIATGTVANPVGLSTTPATQGQAPAGVPQSSPAVTTPAVNPVPATTTTVPVTIQSSQPTTPAANPVTDPAVKKEDQ